MANVALFSALRSGQVESVRSAIARGANVNARDDRGRTDTGPRGDADDAGTGMVAADAKRHEELANRMRLTIAGSPIAIIADGSSLVVRDRKLATQDVYPLSQTPLRFLLSDRIDLLKDTNVVSVTADDVFISVTIEEKQALVGTSRFLLMIGAKDGKLKQWTVTDPQGYDTTVAVYNLDATQKPDPGLFKIDFTTYPGSSPG